MVIEKADREEIAAGVDTPEPRRDTGRVTEEQALRWLRGGDLLALGRAARDLSRRLYPGGMATFVVDRNINYTNVCISGCRFCAFYRPPGHPEAYVLSPEEVMGRVAEAVELGATQVMLQGGLNPGLDLDYLLELVRGIKARFPVEVHSFSPPEIQHFAERSGMSTLEVLAALREAGLDSLPGGGAEILSDRVRGALSPRKVSAGRWLEIMEEAHRLGMGTTATMMMGSIESLEERVEHLSRIRALQDRTGGFRAFILWTFQPGNTELGGSKAPVFDYLRTLATARLFLDNVPHVQGSWVTMGPEVGQLTLSFGADDLGSLMLEENVVRATGTFYRLSREEMVRLIRAAGLTPAQRDTRYRVIRVFDEVGG